MKPTISISDDQNQVTINDSTFDFSPVKKVKKNHCRWCWLLRGVDDLNCEETIPCRSWERKDKKDGVFSIREMPETEPQKTEKL